MTQHDGTKDYEYKGRCAHCNYKVDRAGTFPDGQKPQPPTPGDICMCIQCGEFSIFCNDGALRKPSIEESIELSYNHDVQRARVAWRKARLQL